MRDLAAAFALALCFVATVAFAQGAIPQWREKGWCSFRYPVDRSPPPRLNLPAWACEASYAAGLQSRYTPDTTMNPFFLSGDFNGDGKSDIALWVRNKSRKLGVLILTQGGTDYFVAGAGNNTEGRGDDYRGLDVWSLFKKGDVLESHWESGTVLLKGDAIILEKSESAAFAIYWNGKRYAFYQLSD